MTRILSGFSMTLSHQQKITAVLLVFYWIVLFVFAHIPIPKVVREADVSDKSLHFLVYLILVFLLWFTVSDGKKMRARQMESNPGFFEPLNNSMASNSWVSPIA